MTADGADYLVLRPSAEPWNWLGQAVREGQVLQHANGTRTEPYQYSLPGMVEKWQANFIADFTRLLETDAAPEFPETWFRSVRSVGHAVAGNGIRRLLAS